MKVFVTGGNGFVGSHIVESLLEKGHHPVCLVRKSSDLQWLNGLPVEYAYGDITNPDSLINPIKTCDAIIHCAGLVRAFTLEEYLAANQLGTRNIVTSIQKYNPRINKLVYISSQAAMGPSTSNTPKTVNEKETPVSDYGKSKLAGEKELEVLRNKVPYTILRPSSVYGPRDKDIYIFFNLISHHIQTYPLQQRFIQMVFVKDLAHFAVDTLTNERSHYKTFFIAEEKPYTARAIGNIISEITGTFTIPIPVPDVVFYLGAFITETLSKFNKKPAVLNLQKIDEMTQKYWLGDTVQTLKDYSLGFTNFKNGATITYSWYKENKWL